MISFVKENKWFLLASFVLPAGILMIALAMIGIHWNSNISMMAGDSYHQYVAVLTLYRNILHSNSGFLYTFTSGLGLNLYAFSAYYTGSFFMPLTYFFNVHNMPDALYLLTVLKIGAIGLTSFISVKNMYKKLSNLTVLALSISFSLMSFIGSQIEIIMWLDVFILLPLIIWGMQRLQDLDRRKLYFITLTILFIQNYYFGFMVAIFLVLYFLARSTFDKKFAWKKLLDFAITSALSGLTSLIMLLPMYLDLRANNSGALSNLTGILTENSKPLDIFAKNFIGSYDTTQFNAVPMIYIGLFSLILAVLFFFVKTIRWRTKFAFLGLLAVFIASFYLQALDLFWQGMHAPNMFLHRYSFLFSLLILLMACEALSRIRQVKSWQIFTVFGVLTAFFIATALVRQYHYLTFVNFALTFLYGVAYLLLLLSQYYKWISKKWFAVILLLFMASEAGLNSYYQFEGIQKEWNFAKRDYYNQQTKLFQPLVDKTDSNQFSRLENTTPDTANDGMKFNYNSLSQFSSVRNSNASSLMSNLGFYTDGTYLNLRYPGNTLLMDSILGVKYNINQFQPDKYGFDSISQNLYQNENAQSLGIIVPDDFKNAQIKSNPLDEAKIYLQNQTNFVNALTHENQTFYHQIYTTSEHTDSQITGNDNQVTLTHKTGKIQTGDVSVTYTLHAEAGQQLYLAIPNVIYGSSTSTSTNVAVGNRSYWMDSSSTGIFFNLGTYNTAQNVKVVLSFPGNSLVTFDTTSFWALDTNAYQSAINKLDENKVTAKAVKNGVNLDYNSQKSGQMLLTIPYDKGWSAKLDGKSVKLDRAQNGFMKVNISAGKHEIKLHFFPQGLKIGIVCFIIGIGLFVIYDRKKAQK